MSEKIITEFGQVTIEIEQPTPAPSRMGLAHALKNIMIEIDNAETNILLNQNMLDRICSQLTNEQWKTLAVTQITIIATRNQDAKDYLLSIKT